MNVRSFPLLLCSSCLSEVSHFRLKAVGDILGSVATPGLSPLCWWGFQGPSPNPTCFRESVTFSVGVPGRFRSGAGICGVLTKTEMPAMLQEALTAGVRTSVRKNGHSLTNCVAMMYLYCAFQIIKLLRYLMLHFANPATLESHVYLFMGWY